MEAKLSRVLGYLSDEPVRVTGLYGGTDWGPTDAWLTSAERTVLICTYEKAEALLRFLGPLFIHRVALLVIDEAHSVQAGGDVQGLRTAESRPLRLESLGMRLMSQLSANRQRVIALSAVASGAEDALAGWAVGQADANPVRATYRSTRQLIGRLECLPGGRFAIRYDLLDGASLYSRDIGDSFEPFVPDPFPPHPAAQPWLNEGPEKRLRPYLFWAAMQLAAPDDKGRQQTVLVSVTQSIGGYADDLLKLLESTWADIQLPRFFDPPSEAAKSQLWATCLRSCEDYFGTGSREYRLLQRGIVAHHGKMPGLMARLLVQLLDERVVHLVLATSTLSEGVNLPFETVLIPTLRRARGYLDSREFGNLVGRAGRPGVSTEGQSLVLLPADANDWSSQQIHNTYFNLVGALRGSYSDSSFR